jgi:hypothetical protein
MTEPNKRPVSPGNVRGEGSPPLGAVKAGESLSAGDPVVLGEDGTVRRSVSCADNLFERGILRRLKEQGWRCAYPCADGRTIGRPLLPGEPLATAYDNYGLIHLECAKYGTVPEEGNPWSSDKVRNGEE